MIAAAAFVLAMGAGTAGRLLIKPPAAGQTAEETAKDPANRTAHDATPAGATLASAATAPPPAAGDAASSAQPRAGTGSAVTNGDSSKERSGVEFFEMTRILVGLPPADAAIFVGQLDDNHAIALFRSMAVKDAAAILAYMPAKRQQGLKERLLESPRAGR